MVVDSPLALFTTLFGWQFYNAIWFTLLGTGIALLPFLGVLIEATITDREDGEFFGSNPESIYKRIEAKILIMLAVVALAAQPAEGLTELEPGTITFTPEPTLLEPQPAQSTAADPNNTFGDTGFTDFAEVNADSVPVPVWWFTVLSVSSGINAAVLAGFPTIDSIRDITRLAQALNISDPVVRSETSAFFTHCYIPAKSAFERQNPLGANAVDISYIGSSFFLNDFVPNGANAPIYDILRPTRIVQGFPFDPARDLEWQEEFQPEFGMPRCSEWWLGQNTNGRPGLRQLLLDQLDIVDDGIVESLVAAVTPLVPAALGGEAIEDRLIQAVLTRDPPDFSNNSFGESAFEPGDGLVQRVLRNFVQPVVTVVGVEGAAIGFALYMEVITQVLPMLQPMILMGIYALLPFAIVASRFSLSFLATGAIGIFTINFWPVLWHMATWVDDNLLLALFPSSIDNDGSTPLFDVMILMRGVMGTAGETKITLLNMVTASLFLFLPMLFSLVMMWAGVQAARSLQSMTNVADTNYAAHGASKGPSVKQTAGLAKSGVGSMAGAALKK